MSAATFTLLLDGRPAFRGLTKEEVRALVETARKYGSTNPTVDSGIRIDTRKETP